METSNDDKYSTISRSDNERTLSLPRPSRSRDRSENEVSLNPTNGARPKTKAVQVQVEGQGQAEGQVPVAGPSRVVEEDFIQTLEVTTESESSSEDADEDNSETQSSDDPGSVTAYPARVVPASTRSLDILRQSSLEVLDVSALSEQNVCRLGNETNPESSQASLERIPMPSFNTWPLKKSQQTPNTAMEDESSNEQPSLESNANVAASSEDVVGIRDRRNMWSIVIW